MNIIFYYLGMIRWISDQKVKSLEFRQMAQWLRILDTLAEDLG